MAQGMDRWPVSGSTSSCRTGLPLAGVAAVGERLNLLVIEPVSDRTGY